MASLEMSGPYALTCDQIDRVILVKSAGNYGLGYSSNSSFTVLYVGRSDSDVNARLKCWVGNPRYSQFKFSYATSPKAAFEKECRNYHDFGGSQSLDNEIHPQRPQGTDWRCPVCPVFNPVPAFRF